LTTVDLRGLRFGLEELALREAKRTRDQDVRERLERVVEVETVAL